MLSRAAARGSGAMASTESASACVRSAKARSAAGKYCSSAFRSRLLSRVRFQTSCCWARARTCTAEAAALSPATSRWLWRSVRTRLASMRASPLSDFLVALRATPPAG